jgi:hypothetical protein
VVRWAIIRSNQTDAAQAREHRIDRKTVANWKARNSDLNRPMGPTIPEPRLLTAREEAVIVAYRSRTRLSLDNCLEKLRELIPTLTRSTLYWCLRRYGLNKTGPTAKTARTNEDVFEGPYCFDITLDLIPLPMARSRTTSRLRSSRRPTGARLLISTSKMSVSCAGRISFSWRSSRRPIGSYADVFDHPSPTTQRSFCAISSRRCPRRSILWRPQDRLSSGPGASISRMI